MIKFIEYQAEGYKLVVAEAPGFQYLDLNTALYPKSPLFPKVQGQGCVILVVPSQDCEKGNEAIAAFLGIQYKNTCKWIATADWDSRLAGVVCSFEREVAVGTSFLIDVPCLKCLEDGNFTAISLQAKAPYCKNHRAANPSRKRSRRKES